MTSSGRQRTLPTTVELTLGLDDSDDMPALRDRVGRELGVGPEDLPALVLQRRTLDARRGRVRFRYTLGLMDRAGPAPERPVLREVAGPPVVIIGMGPAGLFCAHELARHGVASTLVERGRRVQPRRRDLKGLNQHGRVDEDSNYCFGEGGAGTYSDGKLYTRATKRGNVHDVLETLVEHGAPESILVEARPHIGSNRLPKVVAGISDGLAASGVRLLFESRVTGLVLGAASSGRPVQGVEVRGSSALEAAEVVIATGHSARDVFDWLADAGAQLAPKPFAVGVRIEHPQPLIDRIQYGAQAGHPRLPAAAYELKSQVEGGAVFSFCMCPGGFIVPASTDPAGLVVNGMSLSRRDSPFANSGLVCTVTLEDLERVGFHGPMGGVALQSRLECAAMAAGGGTLAAPATRVTDFLAVRGSTTVPKTSYQPGLVAGDLADVLGPIGLDLDARLRAALVDFGRRLRGYATEEAVLVGVESRSSSPVRVVRDPDTLMAPGIPGLYPCGEGAGYAGGIVSAALDGVRVARAIVEARGLRPE